MDASLTTRVLAKYLTIYTPHANELLRQCGGFRNSPKKTNDITVQNFSGGIVYRGKRPPDGTIKALKAKIGKLGTHGVVLFDQSGKPLKDNALIADQQVLNLGKIQRTPIKVLDSWSRGGHNLSIIFNDKLFCLRISGNYGCSKFDKTILCKFVIKDRERESLQVHSGITIIVFYHPHFRQQDDGSYLFFMYRYAYRKMSPKRIKEIEKKLSIKGPLQMTTSIGSQHIFYKISLIVKCNLMNTTRQLKLHKKQVDRPLRDLKDFTKRFPMTCRFKLPSNSRKFFAMEGALSLVIVKNGIGDNITICRIGPLLVSTNHIC